MSWMIVLMSKGGRRPFGMVAGARLPNRDAVRRPVGGDHLSDQILPGHRAPGAGVAGARPVVAHHEVLALRNVDRAERPVVAPARLDVRLVQLLPVDVDVAVLLLPGVARKADQALDEGAAGAALDLGERRGLEDDDVAPLRREEVVTEPAREDAIRVMRLAAEARLGAV